jgi:hypothetical protein
VATLFTDVDINLNLSLKENFTIFLHIDDLVLLATGYNDSEVGVVDLA